MRPALFLRNSSCFLRVSDECEAETTGAALKVFDNPTLGGLPRTRPNVHLQSSDSYRFGVLQQMDKLGRERTIGGGGRIGVRSQIRKRHDRPAKRKQVHKSSIRCENNQYEDQNRMPLCER